MVVGEVVDLSGSILLELGKIGLWLQTLGVIILEIYFSCIILGLLTLSCFFIVTKSPAIWFLIFLLGIVSLNIFLLSLKFSVNPIPSSINFLAVLLINLDFIFPMFYSLFLII